MTILADSEIIRLCSVPTFMVTENRMIPDVNNHRWETIEFPVYVSEDLILEKIEQYKNTSMGIRSYRELTVDEKSNHPIMISPFVDHQVKVEQRRITQSEIDFYLNNPDNDPSRIIAKYPGSDVYVKENKVISYGVSSYGYDVRIAPEFKIFTNINSTVIDPKNFDEKSFVDFSGDVCIIPPNSFVLARSVEYMKMPNNVTGIVLGKSTYARTGISCLATPLECGWEGHITLEFANTTPLPAMLYANEGAAQVVFFEGNIPANVSYATRGGKYQSQRGITLPKA